MILYNLSIQTYNVIVPNKGGKMAYMEGPANGLEFLEKLHGANGKKIQLFQDLSGYLSIKAREKGIPFTGQFELTPLCNFSCRMCYVHLNRNQLCDHPILSVETWKDLMHQAWEAGMIKAALTGGECLVYPGFDELFLYLHSLGCEVSVMTNGFLLNDQRIRFFQEHMPALIQVSLYGWNDDVYERVTGQRAFTAVYANIRKAIDAGLPLVISITPNVYLGDDVLETIRAAKSICRKVLVNSSVFTPRRETGRSEHQDNVSTDLYVKIYQLLNELDGKKSNPIPEEQLPQAGGNLHECTECGLRCGGGRSGFVIDWKGAVLPCNRLDMIRGDALADGFSEAWRTVNQEANQWPRVPECEGCAYAKVCNNCAANILVYGKPGKRPAELCERTRYLVKNGVWHIPDCE